jgi:hypothetical protein
VIVAALDGSIAAVRQSVLSDEKQQRFGAVSFFVTHAD